MGSNDNSMVKDNTEESKEKQKQKYCLEDFELKETITRGAFGIIELVKHIKTQKPFVLKRISKDSIK